MKRIAAEELDHIVRVNRLRGNSNPAIERAERAAFTIRQDAERIKELESECDTLSKGVDGLQEMLAHKCAEVNELKKAILAAFPKCMYCQQPAVSYIEDEGMYCSQKCANDNGCECDVQDFILDDDWLKVGQLLGLIK